VLENCFSDIQNVILTHENDILPPAVVNYRWIDPGVVNYHCTPTQLKKKEIKEKTPMVVNYRGV
jgi:hypothetical protein